MNFNIEKISADFFGRITGISEKAAWEVLLEGDTFRIKEKKYKIKEKKDNFFICYVWQQTC